MLQNACRRSPHPPPALPPLREWLVTHRDERVTFSARGRSRDQAIKRAPDASRAPPLPGLRAQAARWLPPGRAQPSLAPAAHGGSRGGSGCQLRWAGRGLFVLLQEPRSWEKGSPSAGTQGRWGRGSQDRPERAEGRSSLSPRRRAGAKGGGGGGGTRSPPAPGRGGGSSGRGGGALPARGASLRAVGAWGEGSPGLPGLGGERLGSAVLTHLGRRQAPPGLHGEGDPPGPRSAAATTAAQLPGGPRRAPCERWREAGARPPRPLPPAGLARWLRGQGRRSCRQPAPPGRPQRQRTALRHRRGGSAEPAAPPPHRGRGDPARPESARPPAPAKLRGEPGGGPGNGRGRGGGRPRSPKRFAATRPAASRT